MIPRTFLKPLLAAAALSAMFAVNSARAVPVSATEQINIIIAQNQPVEIVFPNVFDLSHPKVLELHGFLTGPTPGTLAVFFDWFDQGGTHFFSPVQEFMFFPGAQNPVDMVFTIPFCPDRVSVDFRLGDAPLVNFVGDFTHTCLTESVPEGGSTLPLLGCALGALGFFEWRRKNRSCFR